MPRHSPVTVDDRRAPAPAPAPQPPDTRKHPPPEDDFGGGDICSPERDAPTEDDRPLE